MTDLSGAIRRARKLAKGGKRKRCSKGKSCSATCIFGLDKCLVEMSDDVSGSIGRFRGRLVRLKGRPERFTPKTGQKGLLEKRADRLWSTHAALVERAKTSGEMGRIKEYKRLERRILDLESLSKTAPYSGSAPPGFKPTVKGEYWGNTASAREEREAKRRENYEKIKDKLLTKLEIASRPASGGLTDGDILRKFRERYDDAENKLNKVIEKTGSRYGDKPLEKGLLWRKAEFDDEKNRAETMLTRYAMDGDRKRYDNKVDQLAEQYSKKVGASYGDKEKIWNDNIAHREREYRKERDLLESEVAGYSSEGRRGSYEKAERGLREYVKERGGEFGDKPPDKEDIWKKGEDDRLALRERNYYRAKANLSGDALRKAFEGAGDKMADSSISYLPPEYKRGRGQSLDGTRVDVKKLLKRVDAWQKEHNLNSDSVAIFHDCVHILLRDYLGKSSSQISRLLGDISKSTSVAEEVFADSFSNLASGKQSPWTSKSKFLASETIRKEIKSSLRLSADLGYLGPDSYTSRNMDRVVDRFEKMFQVMAKRRDFESFLVTLQRVYRELYL